MATLAAFVLVRDNHAGDGGVTAAFLTLALAQTAHAFNTRSRRRSVFSRHVFENGWLWLAGAICVLLQLVAVYAPGLRRCCIRSRPARRIGVSSSPALFSRSRWSKRRRP